MGTAYDTVEQNIAQNYERTRILKETDQELVEQVRHLETKKLYICRRYQGDADSFKKLIGVDTEHLPHIYEAASYGNAAITLEEYIPGSTLEEILKSGPLPGRRVRAIGLQLVEALESLHALGLVHLDIKPANVILNDNQVVLVDFMSTRTVGRQAECSGERDICKAPEQTERYIADYRTDFYALGVLFNLLLTGKDPKVKRARGQWGVVISRCIAENPQKRWQSLRAISATIKKHFDALLLAILAAVIVFALIFFFRQVHFPKTYEGTSTLKYTLDDEAVRLYLFFENDKGELLREDQLALKANLGTYHEIPLSLRVYGADKKSARDLFLQHLKQADFQILPMDGALPVQVSDAPEDEIGESVLEKVITYGPDCGSNEIVCRLSMKNGDTLKLRQTLTCKKQ